MHGLQKSATRIYLIINKIARGASVPKPDQRGRHENRPNRVPDEIVQNIRRHIKSIPTYRSHYSRVDNPDKVYFAADLNVSKLHDYYKDWCLKHNERAASEDKYRRIFGTEFNIGFKLPKSDTCKTCDSCHIKLSNLELSAEEMIKIKEELETHQKQAEEMQNELKKDIQLSQDHEKDVITFDLQQVNQKTDYNF